MKKYCMIFKQLLRNKSSRGEEKMCTNHDLRFKYIFYCLGDVVYYIQKFLPSFSTVEWQQEFSLSLGILCASILDILEI